MKLAILGAGKMGEALARGILRAGLLAPDALTLADVAAVPLAALAGELGAIAAADNAAAVRDADVVILAVKPPLVPVVCRQIAGALPVGAVVLSIAAGVTLATIGAALTRDDVILVRAMPNTPCLVGAGAIGISFAERQDGIPATTRQLVLDLLAPLGLVAEFSESQLDAVTGLSGSGPAYIALLIEALADGGVLVGLPRAVAQQFAAQTVFGTAKLVLDTGQHPAQVKDAVSSPGGTTIAGVRALEDHGFRAALIAAVSEATRRARELSGQ